MPRTSHSLRVPAPDVTVLHLSAEHNSLAMRQGARVVDLWLAVYLHRTQKPQGLKTKNHEGLLQLSVTPPRASCQVGMQSPKP